MLFVTHVHVKLYVHHLVLTISYPLSAFFLRINYFLYRCSFDCQIVTFFLTEAERDHFHLEGLMESPSADDDGDCFSPLLLNATSVKIEVYYNKAVNYTLMVTFVSFNHEYSYSFMSVSQSVMA